jgi:hypothetical protein
VRHWSVRIHEAAVLLTSIRPVWLPTGCSRVQLQIDRDPSLPLHGKSPLLRLPSPTHLTSPCGTGARVLFYLIYPPHRTSRFSVAVSGGGYPFFVSLAAAAADLSRTLTGRRARTSPTGTPPSLTTTSGGCGTNSPSSSTSSSSFSPRRFVLLLLVL